MRIQTGQNLNPCTDLMKMYMISERIIMVDWMNFEAEVDRMFALLSELNR